MRQHEAAGVHAHAAEHDAAHHADLLKHREIRFAESPPGQAESALKLLAGLEGLTVAAGRQANAIDARYELTDYTLEGIEDALIAQGFRLDDSMYTKLLRAIVHYCEETQLANLRSPERLIKKSNEVYIKAWEHHPHGDHDDMPPELRDYK